MGARANPALWIGGRGVPIRTGRVTVVMGHFYRVRGATRIEKRPSRRGRKMTVVTSSSTILTSSSTIFCVTRRMCNYQPRSGHAPRRTLSSASAPGYTHAKPSTMKTSFQKRSLRSARFALALALGLAAASHSAQAATVQITLNRIFTTSSTGGYVNNVTGQSTASNLFLIINNDPGALLGVSLYGSGFGTVAYSQYNFSNNFTGVLSSSSTFTFNDSRINNGATTTGHAQGVAIMNGTTPSVNLTRIVFNDASTVAPSGFSQTDGAYTEWSPTSTAVPEPGTFIPAAMLVAGAFLRRRRSRSHRSGRAAA